MKSILSHPRRFITTVTVVLLTTSTTLTLSQASGTSPNVQCTNNLCRPIGHIMSTCVDSSGQTSPNEITWDDLYEGNNVTDPDTGDVVSSRLRCFCRSVGIGQMLDNCYTCYMDTNQQAYWQQGIAKIKERCGIPLGITSEGSESMSRITPMVLSGLVGGLGIGVGMLL